MPKKSLFRSLLLPTLILAGLDQLVKFLVIRGLREYSINRGLSFFGESLYLSVGLYILFFAVLIFLIFKTGLNTGEKSGIAIPLLLSGASSNLVDRLLRGGVVDFIDIKVWPVFNLADVFIAIGAFWLCFIYLAKRN